MRQIALLFLIIFFVNVTGVFSFTDSFAQGTAGAEVNAAAVEDTNQNIMLFNAEDNDVSDESDADEKVQVLENNKIYSSYKKLFYQGKVILEQDNFFQCTIDYWWTISGGYGYVVYYDIFIYTDGANDVAPLTVNSYYGRTYPQFLSAGEYNVLIIPYLGKNNGSYSMGTTGNNLNSFFFYISYSPNEYYETEYNSSADKANNIEPECLIRGNLLVANDEDWYVFDIPSKKRVTVTFSHNALGEEEDPSSYWHYELFDSNLNSITGDNVGGSVLEKNSKIELESGIYYISVSSNIASSTQYQIEVSVKNPSIWSYTWTWVIVGIVAVMFVVGFINYIRIILKRKA